ncbi:MAG: hypothetical protein ACTHJ3_13360 [Pararhizobium sp.]
MGTGGKGARCIGRRHVHRSEEMSSMFTVKSAMLGMAVVAFAAAPAFAATSMSGSKMAPSEVKTMHTCQSMSHSAMMKDKNCTALMKKYPKMMSSKGFMHKGSMSTSSMKGKGGSMKKSSMSGGSSKTNGSMNSSGGSMGGGTQAQ